MPRLSGITAVFPCYRDERTIGPLVEAALRVLPDLCDAPEVVVVDDASPDGAGEVLDGLERKYPGTVRTVRHRVNQGYGAAVRAGLAAATREFVSYTDGDGQYDVADLPALVACMEDGVGLVNGWKRRRVDPLPRIVVGRVYHAAVTRAFGLRIRDVHCDFRLMRASVLKARPLRVVGGALGVELVRTFQDSGLEVREVPVSHRAREHGRSTFFRPARVATTLAELAGLWWEMRGGGKG